MPKKIMWDKGHGGADPGAVGNGLREADLTNDIVDYAMSYLALNYTGFEQRATRSKGETLDLMKRDDEADSWGADVFISVHINAGGGTGFESFIYNGGAGSSTIALQHMVHNEVLSAMRKFGEVIDRGKKRANFAVLRETNMDAVLTESLFIDSTTDASKLKNKAFIKAVGEAHARGVAKFLGLNRSRRNIVQVIKTGSTSTDRYMFKTGWFSEGTRGLQEMEKYLIDNGWDYTKVKENKSENSSTDRYMFKTGWFREGTRGLQEVEKYLMDNGWDYTKVKENKPENAATDRYMFKTGWFREGTRGLQEMEKYLMDNDWDYVKMKEEG
jgi:N-acetylmuramoyl-L-alanine amidase